DQHVNTISRTPVRTLSVFLFNATATTDIYSLSLHDALPICHRLFRRNPPSTTTVSNSALSSPVQRGLLMTAKWSRSRSSCRPDRSEEHTSELQSRSDLVCRLLLEKKKKNNIITTTLSLVHKK